MAAVEEVVDSALVDAAVEEEAEGEAAGVGEPREEARVE